MQNVGSVSALLLLALVGGFLFAYRCHAFSYQAARVEGQRLLFVAAGWAVILVIWSRASLVAAEHIFSADFVDGVSQAWESFTEPVGGGWTLATFFGALVWGWLLASLVNVFYRPKRAS